MPIWCSSLRFFVMNKLFWSHTYKCWRQWWTGSEHMEKWKNYIGVKCEKLESFDGSRSKVSIKDLFEPNRRTQISTSWAPVFAKNAIKYLVSYHRRQLYCSSVGSSWYMSEEKVEVVIIEWHGLHNGVDWQEIISEDCVVHEKDWNMCAFEGRRPNKVHHLIAPTIFIRINGFTPLNIWQKLKQRQEKRKEKSTLSETTP